MAQGMRDPADWLASVVVAVIVIAAILVAIADKTLSCALGLP